MTQTEFYSTLCYQLSRAAHGQLISTESLALTSAVQQIADDLPVVVYDPFSILHHDVLHSNSQNIWLLSDLQAIAELNENCTCIVCHPAGFCDTDLRLLLALISSFHGGFLALSRVVFCDTGVSSLANWTQSAEFEAEFAFNANLDTLTFETRNDYYLF